MKEFLKKKNIIFSAKRYGIDALGAMAQGLFASLLIGTIISTLGEQLGIDILVTVGTYAKGATGAAMAISIGYALQCPPLVLFSLTAVGMAANELGAAGGPLAVLIVSIFAAEFGKLVSKETKIDIIVTPFVTIAVGVLLSLWWAPAIGYAASTVGNAIMWATELQPFFMGAFCNHCSRCASVPVVGSCHWLCGQHSWKCHYVGNRTPAILHGNSGICDCWYCINITYQQRCYLRRSFSYRSCRWRRCCRMLCPDGWFCSYEL